MSEDNLRIEKQLPGQTKMVGMLCRNPPVWNEFTASCKADQILVWFVAEELIIRYLKEREERIKADKEAARVAAEQSSPAKTEGLETTTGGN
jgi:hypothetical protein